MKRAKLLLLATTVCLTGCYGESSETVLNPYDLNKKQSLVKEPEQSEEQSAAEADQVAQSAGQADDSQASNSRPDPDANRSSPDDQPGRATPDPSDLAGGPGSGGPSSDDRQIDPRLLERPTPSDSRYQPIRPAEPGNVRPTAGETELDSRYQPAEEVDPPAIAASENSPAEDPSASKEPATETAADASAAQPEIGDLALDQPSNLTVPENIPPVADTPPSLTEPEINSVNKPPLEEAPLRPREDQPVPAADKPAADMRPSDRLFNEPKNSTDRPLQENATGSEPDPQPLSPRNEARQPLPLTDEERSASEDSETGPMTREPMPGEGEQPSMPLEEASKLRTWVDNTGRLRVEAQFIRFEHEKVYLKTKEGNELQIPLKRFSRRDKQFLQQIKQGDFGI